MLAAERLLDVALHLERELRREDAGVLGLVLLQDVRLHRAPHVPQDLAADACVGLRVDHAIARDPEQAQTESVVVVGEIPGVRGQRLSLRRERRGEVRDRGLEFAALAQVRLDGLIDRRVQEEREHRRRGSVDRERNTVVGAERSKPE